MRAPEFDAYYSAPAHSGISRLTHEVSGLNTSLRSDDEAARTVSARRILVSAAASVHAYVDNLRHASYGNACLIIARAQLLVFIVHQTKIEYRCDKNDPFQVWLLFGLIVATQHTAARFPSLPEEPNWGRHRSHGP